MSPGAPTGGSGDEREGSHAGASDDADAGTDTATHRIHDEPTAAAPAGEAEHDPDTDPRLDPVDARVAAALERVAHGATVSVPSILFARAMTVAFTAVLTNGFAAGPYGVFAVARRLQKFLLSLTHGLRRGLSRYIPTAETDAERDAIVTFACLLLVAVATAFGVALYLAVPLVTRLAGQGALFRTLLRVFALGLPVMVWLSAMEGVLRGLEAVGPLNLAVRVGFPVAQLGVAVVGVVLVGDLVAVAAGVVGVMGLTGLVVTAWLVRERGVRPRFRIGLVDGTSVWRRYVRYSVPVFLGGIAVTVQRLGFYPLIALSLSDVAGGVFAVGVLLGSLVRLPLTGINQFIPPVAAALHENGHHEALARLYQVTSRLVVVGVTGLAVPLVVYRHAVMGLFGPTFVGYAPLVSGFVLAQFAACAAGSVGILLLMTDHERAALVVNAAVTLVVAVAVVVLTVRFGFPGLVLGYVLMLALNNGSEVVALYYLEGLQPITRRHAYPFLAAVPLVGVALLVRAVLGSAAPLVGTGLGLCAYGWVLKRLGFTPVERRLGGTLLARYRAALGRVGSRVR